MFTIYPKDLTPECRARLEKALQQASGETLKDTNWDAFGCAQVDLPVISNDEHTILC